MIANAFLFHIASELFGNGQRSEHGQEDRNEYDDAQLEASFVDFTFQIIEVAAHLDSIFAAVASVPDCKPRSRPG